jgi:hypothetical protein
LCILQLEVTHVKLLEAQRLFQQFEAQKTVYRTCEIGRLLQEDGEKLRSSIRRLEAAEVVRRVAHGVYWHRPSCVPRYEPIEETAAMLRFGLQCFVGLESAAARWGVISQIPVGRLTVVTTGREGTFQTPFGTIEFVHTKADDLEIIQNTVAVPGSPLRLATKGYTVEGLKRTRRSLDLVDWDELAYDD